MANSSVVGLLKVVLSADTAAFSAAMRDSSEMAQEFARAGRSPWSALLYPGRVTSRQMGLDNGLIFLFHRGGRILVRGVAGSRHFQLAGRPVPAHPVPAAEAELRARGEQLQRLVAELKAREEETPHDGSC